MKKYLLLLFVIMTNNSWADKPIFSVTPNLIGASQLVQGQIGSYIYQVTNNTKNTLSNIGVIQLPVGVSVLPIGQASSLCGVHPELCQYCTFPLTLESNNSCLIKVNVNTNVTEAIIKGGPRVCFTHDRPVYCSQPYSGEQLYNQILPGPISSVCQDNISNFNYALSLPFDSATDYDPDWGPARNTFPLSPSNPNLTSCVTDNSWQQQRVLAAAQFWVSQKLNYCEHHVPDFATPIAIRGNIYGDGGYCNPIVDLAPNTPYYQQQARWNYSGSGSETANNWVNNNAMWYGFDCSNYQAFLYDFALNINFSSGIQQQSGQIDSTSTAGPNNGGAQTIPNLTSGPLVCVDGTVTCSPSSGQYISTIDSSGTYNPNAVPVSLLNSALQPGDLIYIAGSLNERAHSSDVTHVVMWTGFTIGTGANTISPSQIAPNELCQQYWQPIIGQPVITDSHYQGPDYRMLTQCFYLENVWAVRRPIS